MKYVLILAAASFSLPAHAFDPGAAVVSRVVSQNNNQIVQQQVNAVPTAGGVAGNGGYQQNAGATGVPQADANGNFVFGDKTCGPGSSQGVCTTPVAPKGNGASALASVPVPKVVGPTSLDFNQSTPKPVGSTTSGGGTRIGNGFAIGNAEPEEVPDWMLKAAQPAPRNSSGSTSMR